MSQDILILKITYQNFISNLLTFNRLCVIIIISKIRFVNLDIKSEKIYLDTLLDGKGSKNAIWILSYKHKKAVDR